MSKPLIHAQNTARRFGGKPEDYLPIHTIMDSSKSVIGDNRHRAFTHNSWFIGYVIPLVFGEVMTNSDGVLISTRQIAEDHCLQDFGGRFIPSGQDWLQELEVKHWMQDGSGKMPPSCKKIERTKKSKFTRFDRD